jgi:hypothetical protein
MAINLAFPALGASGVPTVTSRLAIHVMIALGLWLGLERAELTPSQRRNVWLAVMIPFTLWLAVVWSAAINGFFKPGGAIPVLPLAALGPVIIGVPILLRSRRIGQISRRDAGQLDRRAANVPRPWRHVSRGLGVWRGPGHICAAGRGRRFPHRFIRGASRDLSRIE